MQVPEVLKQIAESEPGEWQFIGLPYEEKEVYRYSFNTEYRLEHHDPWGENQEYNADWTEDLLGDAKLDTSYYIYHLNTPIMGIDVAIVANGNVRLPIHNVHERYLSRLDYTIAQILNSDYNRLRHVLDTAEIELSDRLV